MKVILLKDVPKQGKKEQIIEVSDGYAHNYLIKNNLAVIANESNVSKLKKTLENRKANEKELILEMKELKNKLEKEKLEFKVKVGEKDKVFGSISHKQILLLLKDKDYNIKKEQIEIPNLINSLGMHEINIHLHKEVIAKLLISVSK